MMKNDEKNELCENNKSNKKNIEITAIEEKKFVFYCIYKMVKISAEAWENVTLK